MASSDDPLPRLDVLLDPESEWSVEKFAEAIKLHAMLLWPSDRDTTTRRRHVAIALALHREQVLKSIAAARARDTRRSSAKIDRMQGNLEALHRILMSPRTMTGVLLHSPSFAEHLTNMFKQQENWKKVLMFVDFSIRHAAGQSEEDNPLIIKLFYKWAPISAQNELQSTLDSGRISQDIYIEKEREH